MQRRAFSHGQSFERARAANAARKQGLYTLREGFLLLEKVLDLFHKSPRRYPGTAHGFTAPEELRFEKAITETNSSFSASICTS